MLDKKYQGELCCSSIVPEQDIGVQGLGLNDHNKSPKGKNFPEVI